MHQSSELRYSIILPIHNEELYIADALHSIANQTILPQEVILVNDNSTDKTELILNQFSTKHPFMKVISSESTSTLHQPGSKIISAFYKGFDFLNIDWDVIVKLDADVILPENYFEKVLQTFSSNPNYGIVGGLALIEKNGEWIYENMGNKEQVRGPFKSYSKICFEKIGGLKKSIGWDTVDELLTYYYGMEVRVLPDLEVKLQKPTGKDYLNVHGITMGKAFYRMDYGLAITLIAALKASFKKKEFKLFFSIWKGYFQSITNSELKIVTSEEGKFIRNYRWKKIFNRLTLW